jgi:transcriptional regulator with XRE-family HTH domain
MRKNKEIYKNCHPLLMKIDERGIKQTFLAEKIGISRSRLNNYLVGVRSMPDNIEKLLRELLD